VDIILLVLHVCLALGMITLILLQRGKGASAGAVLGGGGAGSVFGASGSANFLSKTTALLATAFFINSLVLAHMASTREAPASVIDSIEQPASEMVTPKPTVTELDESVPPPEEAPVEAPATDTATQVPPATGATEVPSAETPPAAADVPKPAVPEVTE
jgi:preprotein translocase subunit SecG